MAERAQLFDGNDDFDVSAFTPKKTTAPAPSAEAVRAVSESASFKSREPAPAAAATPRPAAKKQRRRRTGRNLQLNVKVAAATLQSFYDITDRQGWVLGETLERAVAALQRELDAKP